MTDKSKINVLPEEWTYPFLAAWRTMERTLNPVFEFYLKCGSCQSYEQSVIEAVYSKKKKNGQPIVIGLRCGNCDTVLKFEYPISPGSPDFPQRLKLAGASVVELAGAAKKAASEKSKKARDTIVSLLEL